MQLVEIIQLVLVGFIAISLSIFLFSYVGYRRKNKNLTSEQVLDLKNPFIPSNPGIKSSELKQENKTNLSASNAEKIEGIKSKVNKNKFEVFRPSKDKLNQHFPKIIKSDISTETSKKK